MHLVKYNHDFMLKYFKRDISKVFQKTQRRDRLHLVVRIRDSFMGMLKLE